MGPRRRWASILAFLAVLSAATAAAGFAEEGPHETFRTAEPVAGDRGVHRLHVVLTARGEGVFLDANAEAAFHRLPDAWLPVATGEDAGHPADAAGAVDAGLVPVQRHLLEWTTAPFLWDPMMWAAMGGGGWASPAAWQQEQEVEAPNWQVTHHAAGGTVLATTVQAGDPRAAAWAPLLPGAGTAGTVTLPIAAPGPCGFLHGLQGRDHDLRDVLVVQGACPPPVRVAGAAAGLPAGPLRLRVSGEDVVQGRPTLVFATPDDPDALRLWFAADVPYPVRVLSRLAEPAPGVRLYLLHELVAFTRGAGEQAPPPAAAPWDGARGRLGPSEAGIQHPFPLSAAWQSAVADADAGFGSWVEAHPRAVVVEAEHALRAGARGPAHAWRFVASDGGDAREATVVRGADAPIFPLVGATDDVQVRRVAARQWAAPAALPASAPSVAALWDRFEAAGGAPDAARGWGFAFPCTDAACRPDARYVAGLRDEAAGRIDQLLLDADGALVAHVQAPAPYPAPRYDDPGPGWSPQGDGREPWAWMPASVGLWQFPQPKTVAVAGGLAAVAAVLVLLWPVLKGGGLALFTRFTPDELLRHPTRQAILDLTRAQPGIHFQEMARRLGLGRGALDHHLRKLVAAEHLVERTENGYACYFPHGAVDRRLMAAAPLLKSEGARRVLEALVAQPGLANQEVAKAVGMAPSSVHHHVRRLLDAGLLEPRRDGRWLRLHATGLAHDALDTYGEAAGAAA